MMCSVVIKIHRASWMRAIRRHGSKRPCRLWLTPHICLFVSFVSVVPSLFMYLPCMCYQTDFLFGFWRGTFSTWMTMIYTLSILCVVCLDHSSGKLICGTGTRAHPHLLLLCWCLSSHLSFSFPEYLLECVICFHFHNSGYDFDCIMRKSFWLSHIYE